jgi:hypothetical protein
LFYGGGTLAFFVLDSVGRIVYPLAPPQGREAFLVFDKKYLAISSQPKPLKPTPIWDGLG